MTSAELENSLKEFNKKGTLTLCIQTHFANNLPFDTLIIFLLQLMHDNPTRVRSFLGDQIYEGVLNYVP